MRPLFILLAALVAFFLQGCIVRSLHPFFKPGDTLFKIELLNDWIDEGGDQWMIRQVKENPQAYEMRCRKDGREAVFIVHLFELEGVLYLDFMPLSSDAGSVPIFDLHILPTHSVAKVERLQKDRVEIKWFNERWLRSLFEHNRIKIAHETIADDSPADDTDKLYVLTASTDELQKFILKYGHEDSAFNDENTVYLRLTPARQ